MTKEKLEQANRLQQRINEIGIIVGHLSVVDNFKLDPPTRMAGISLRIGIADVHVYLNEGEALCIRNALVAEAERLEKEFEKL